MTTSDWNVGMRRTRYRIVLYIPAYFRSLFESACLIAAISQTVQMDAFAVVKLLGQGACARVFLARDLRSKWDRYARQ